MMRCTFPATTRTVWVSALCAGIASAWGCSLLLDTDKLKEGTPAAATGGTGGTAGDGAAGTMTESGLETGNDVSLEVQPEAAEKTPCKTDADCFLASKSEDLCLRHPCSKDGFCGAPVAYKGPVVRRSTLEPVEISSGHTEIGIPRLMAVGEEVYLAAWYLQGIQPNVLFAKLKDDGTVLTSSEYQTTFSKLMPNVVGTPDMLMDSANSKIDLLLPAGPVGNPAEVCIRRVSMKKDFTQGSMLGCLVSGESAYDADPLRATPRFVKREGTDLEMWIQDGDLYVKRAIEVAGSKRTALGNVRAFAPLRGVADVFGAVFEAGNSVAEENTYYWVSGSPETPLMESDSGSLLGPRYGVTTAWFGEATAGFYNLVVWSHPTQNSLSIVDNLGTLCSAIGCTKPEPQSSIQETGMALTAPAVAARSLSQSKAADTAVGVVLNTGDKSSVSALVTQFIRATEGSEPDYMNPPAIILQPVQLPNNDGGPNAVHGQTAAVMTDNGRTVFSWVRRENGASSLFVQAFQISETCSK